MFPVLKVTYSTVFVPVYSGIFGSLKCQCTSTKWHHAMTHFLIEETSRMTLSCRLTLFNARRGGEPARLTTANWCDAKQDARVCRDRIINRSEEEQRLFDNMKAMYQTGKGNHIVPFVVPTDTAQSV